MRQAIIKTLCYSQVFNFPLSVDEIHHRLIGKKATKQQVLKSLNQAQISQKQGYYFLGSSTDVGKRLSKASVNLQKLAKAQRIASLLKAFPSIQAVYVTGGVAVGNAAVDDDIDLFIVTSPGYIWTTRLFVNIFLDLIGQRRHPHATTVNNQICLNLWLSSDNLTMPKAKQNLYTAYEITQAKLLWDKRQTHQRFLWANHWLLKFLPNIEINKPSSSLVTYNQTLSLIERLAYALQQRIMKAKVTLETISPTQAFFHPRNTQQEIDVKYTQLCQRYL